MTDSDEALHNPNAAPIKRPDANGAPSFRTRAVMSLVRQDDAKILAVKVRDAWTLPGAVLKPGEDEEAGQKRGLRECVGALAGPAVKIYEGPNTLVYVAACGRGFTQGKLPYAWLTEAQFLANTDRVPLFEKVFACSRTHQLAESCVISKLKDGRILFAIQYEVCLRGLWEAREAHYVHAMNAEFARDQFVQLLMPSDPPTRIIGVAPAIGFFQDQKTGDLIG